MVDVTYSAVVRNSDGTEVHLTTQFYGGTWTWYGYKHDMQNGMAILDRYEADPASFWLTSQDAIDAALATFDNPEDTPCGLCGGSFLRGASNRYCDTCLRGESDDVVEDDYPGDVLPTGWDARDHKALYE